MVAGIPLDAKIGELQGKREDCGEAASVFDQLLAFIVFIIQITVEEHAGRSNTTRGDRQGVRIPVPNPWFASETGRYG